MCELLHAFSSYSFDYNYVIQQSKHISPQTLFSVILHDKSAHEVKLKQWLSTVKKTACDLYIANTTLPN